MKPHSQKATHSHYTYLSGPGGMREPTSMMNLSSACQETRRQLVHNVLRNGELLAKLPTGVKDLPTLAAYCAAFYPAKDWDDARR